jgi:hypothetical protein
MYRVALVQNQSEMAHYGYADARALISELGYEVTLYTAQNVGDLSNALPNRRTDALVLGSNALNDKTIRAYFNEESTFGVVEDFLKGGGGLLSFHQLRVAGMDEAHLSFLPDPLSSAAPVARSSGETSASGKLAIPAGAENHTSLLYPNRVTADQIQDQALGFRSLQGLYWHFWRDPGLADWDVLMVDVEAAEIPRPLVLASKETSPYRVMLSALTLDWQRQREMVENALAYVVEGRHNTAVLSQSRSDSQALAYLTAALEARCFPFRRYYLSEGLSSFETHVKNGVHTTVVLGDDVTLEALQMQVDVSVDDLLARGQLKVLSIEPGDDPSRLSGLFSISHQTEAHRHLSLAELAVQAELRTGNIDGSFWSTAETLQVLEALPEVTTDFGPLVGRVLSLAEEHDCEGSYDETFGVTCALYWMRATYLGAEDSKTTATEVWIRDRLDRFEVRERVLAYRTFAMVGTLTVSDRRALEDILASVPHTGPSEIDLIAYIKAAVTAGIVQPLPLLVDQLITALRGNWIDLATTASAASALLDARVVLRADQELQRQVRGDVDDTVRQAVVALQDEMTHFGGAAGAYHWEGKASTTVRCLEAWAKFDTQVAPPVYEVIDQLLGWDQVAAEIATTRTSLAVLDELKEENATMAQRLEVLEPRVRDSDADLRVRRLLSLALAVCAYCILALLVAAGRTKHGGDGELLDFAFVRPWALHLGLATLVVTVVVGQGIAERRASQ